jgi:hypothetical protein
LEWLLFKIIYSTLIEEKNILEEELNGCVNILKKIWKCFYWKKLTISLIIKRSNLGRTIIAQLQMGFWTKLAEYLKFLNHGGSMYASSILKEIA